MRDKHGGHARIQEQSNYSAVRRLGRNCRCRRAPYLNNILERHHRFVKKRILSSRCFRSVDGAVSTIAGYEAMNITLRADRWLPKADIVEQAQFIPLTLGVAA